PAWFRGRELGAGTDLWHYADAFRSGRMTRAEFDELEAVATPSYGHCNSMGTASTMTCLVEALGMCLPGSASIPAVDAARQPAAETTGRRGRAGARGSAPVADPHRAGVRQRDHPPDGDRGLDERGRPSARARRPR